MNRHLYALKNTLGLFIEILFTGLLVFIILKWTFFILENIHNGTNTGLVLLVAFTPLFVVPYTLYLLSYKGSKPDAKDEK